MVSMSRPAGLEPATPGLEEQWRVLEGYAGQRLVALPTRATHAHRIMNPLSQPVVKVGDNSVTTFAYR